jgi:hypothetical protein
MERVRIPPSPPFFHNGNGNKGLAAEQKIFYKSFLRNLRTSRKSQYLAKARKSDAPANPIQRPDGVTLTIKGKWPQDTHSRNQSKACRGNKQTSQTQRLRMSLSQPQEKTEPAFVAGLAGPRQESGCEIPHGTTQTAQNG